MSDNGKVSMLREQIKRAGKTLHQTMEGVTSEVAHKNPGGTANSIAATVAHVVTSTDGIINAMLKGETPLGMSMPSGLSAPPPMGDDLFNWYDWGQALTVDLPVFQDYAMKVFESTDAYLSSLTDADLERSVPSPTGGEMQVFDLLNIALSNISWHTGELAALKGIQGLKGYNV